MTAPPPDPAVSATAVAAWSWTRWTWPAPLLPQPQPPAPQPPVVQPPPSMRQPASALALSPFSPRAPLTKPPLARQPRAQLYAPPPRTQRTIRPEQPPRVHGGVGGASAAPWHQQHRVGAGNSLGGSRLGCRGENRRPLPTTTKAQGRMHSSGQPPASTRGHLCRSSVAYHQPSLGGGSYRHAGYRERVRHHIGPPAGTRCAARRGSSFTCTGRADSSHGFALGNAPGTNRGGFAHFAAESPRGSSSHLNRSRSRAWNYGDVHGTRVPSGPAARPSRHAGRPASRGRGYGGLESRSRQDHHSYSPRSHWRPGADGCEPAWEVRLPCGLLPSQVSDLLFREITPEDYDLLLQLDENVVRPTASRASVDNLPAASQGDLMGKSCPVCLAHFDCYDAVVKLPCQHLFHRSCIAKWLVERKSVCPLCCAEVFPA
mmetsp:Transcript_114085/g.317593  ORF Transcript_114085/g.317593 Transcript_114085/m.317593 type:complete len:430 (+) Transcript_114085:1-1290(+)